MAVLKLPAMRVPPSRDEISDVQAGFAGGANPLGSTGLVPVDQVAAMSNMRLVREQELAKRPGLRALSVSGGSFTTGQRIHAFAADNLFFAGVDSSTHLSLYVYVEAATVPSIVYQSALTSGNYYTGHSSAQFRDGTGECLYLAAMSGGGIGMTKVTTAPAITLDVAGTKVTNLGQLWVYNQRLFGAKGANYGDGTTATSVAMSQTLYWSGLNNGDTMADTANGGGSAAIRTYSGRNIVGGFALGNSNYILHENAISVFRGTTFDDINITAGTSGVAPNIGYPMAWAVIDQVGYIITPGGLYLVTEGGGVQLAGTAAYPDPLVTLLQREPTLTYIPNFVAASPWFVLDNSLRDEVWIIANLANVSGTVESRLFIYNRKLGRFTGQGLFGVTVNWAATVPEGYGMDTRMLFVSGGTVYACELFHNANCVYQDNAVSYTSSVQLRRMFSQEAPGDQKAWRYAYITMGSGAPTAPVAAGSSTGATLGYTNATGTVADTTNMKAQQVNAIQLSGQGPWLDLTVTDSGTSSTGWSVLRAEVEGASYGKRGG